MKQNRIKLTESQLKRMVSEAVKNVLKEDLDANGDYDRQNTAKKVLIALEQVENMFMTIGYELNSLREQDPEYYDSVCKELATACDSVRDAIYIMSQHGLNGRIGKFDSQGFHPDTYTMGMAR